jgi:radical SAM superfamily enzyme
MLLEYRQFSPVVKLMPSGASSKDHDLFKTSTWWSELLRRLQESSSAYGYHLSIQPLFVNRLLVPAMNFPASLQTLWCGKRFNSFNRVLKNLFRSRANKGGLRLDFTAIHRLRSVSNRCTNARSAGSTAVTSVKNFLEAVERMKQRKVRPCTSLSVGFSGETNRAMIVVPEWSVDKRGMHNAIYKTLEARDSWQSKRFAARTSGTSTSRVFDHQQGASL